MFFYIFRRVNESSLNISAVIWSSLRRSARNLSGSTVYNRFFDEFSKLSCLVSVGGQFPKFPGFHVHYIIWIVTCHSQTRLKPLGELFDLEKNISGVTRALRIWDGSIHILLWPHVNPLVWSSTWYELTLIISCWRMCQTVPDSSSPNAAVWWCSIIWVLTYFEGRCLEDAQLIMVKLQVVEIRIKKKNYTLKFHLPW